MTFFLTKILFTSTIIVLITEVAKRSDKLGGLIAALPLTTFLVIFWMYYEGASNEKIATHMRYTLFFVLPTLPMFLAFPYVIEKYGFFIALGASVLITYLCLYVFNLFSEQFGFRLF